MRLLAFDLTGRDAEIVADRCWQAGAWGIWEVDDTTMRAGVADDDLGTFIAIVGDLDPVDVTDVEAIELTGRSVVVEMAGHDIELWVPATVFGDGSHPTTATCLDLLRDLVDPGSTMLDVGCGTGALSIAGAIRGARVTAIDIDPEAVTATADNASRNGVVVSASTTPLSRVAGSFDVVACNMTVGSLGALVPDLVARIRPGGVIVVSGLLADQWEPVCTALGGDVAARRDVDGWVTAVVVVH